MKILVRILLLTCTALLCSCLSTRYEFTPDVSDLKEETVALSFDESGKPNGIVSKKRNIVKIHLNNESENRDEFGSFRVEIEGSGVADDYCFPLAISAKFWPKDLKNIRELKVYKNSEEANKRIINPKYKELANKSFRIGIEGSKALLKTALVATDIALQVASIVEMGDEMSDYSSSWDSGNIFENSFNDLKKQSSGTELKDYYGARELSARFDSSSIIEEMNDGPNFVLPTKEPKGISSSKNIYPNAVNPNGIKFYLKLTELEDEGYLFIEIDLRSGTNNVERHDFTYKVTPKV